MSGKKGSNTEFIWISGFCNYYIRLDDDLFYLKLWDALDIHLK